tara:strand:- start:5801 stop:6469 length:669 start_codon:yes stop_codon:yes gene_type:complete
MKIRNKIAEHDSTRKLDGKLEIRTEKREDGSETKVLRGKAVPYNELSSPIFGFREKFEPGAFREDLENADVRALAHHSSSHVLGRQSAGTLEIDDRDDGLYFEVDLPDTSYARDLEESINRGDITGVSFGFRAVDDEWDENEDGVLIRTVKKARLREVSPVAWPAYPQSYVASESRAFEEVLSEIRSEIRSESGGDSGPGEPALTEGRKATLAAMAADVDTW